MADHTGSDDHPQFKQATVKEVFRLVTEPNTRISAPALHLSSEYLRLFATEAIHRASEVAQKEHDERKAAGDEAPGMLLEARHLEKVLAGLLLDF
ncbi:hypothetical protein JCM10207_004250 [Rhodosporidiobolus poonsookiae]